MGVRPGLLPTPLCLPPTRWACPSLLPPEQRAEASVHQSCLALHPTLSEAGFMFMQGHWEF